YPRAVVQSAIDSARVHAHGGAMLSQYIHPKVAKTDDGEYYIDNHDRKTARIDDISDVMPDGRVVITRTILKTPKGDEVAARIKVGKPPGLSTRFKMT